MAPLISSTASVTHTQSVQAATNVLDDKFLALRFRPLRRPSLPPVARSSALHAACPSPLEASCRHHFVDSSETDRRAQYFFEMLLGHDNKSGVSVWHRPIAWIALARSQVASPCHNLMTTRIRHARITTQGPDKKACKKHCPFSVENTAAQLSFQNLDCKDLSEFLEKLGRNRTAAKGEGRILRLHTSP